MTYTTNFENAILANVIDLRTEIAFRNFCKENNAEICGTINQACELLSLVKANKISNCGKKVIACLTNYINA